MFRPVLSRLAAAVFAATAMLLCVPAQASTLIGTYTDLSGTAFLGRIDSATGALLSQTKLFFGGTDTPFSASIQGLSRGAGGQLYGVFQNPLDMAVLARIDPVTGAVTATDPLNYAGTSDALSGNITGLTEGAGGQLYGVLKNGLDWSILVTIDPAKAEALDTRTLNFAGEESIFLNGLEGLASGPGNLLYGVQQNALGQAILAKVDAASGTVLSTDPLFFDGTDSIFNGNIRGLTTTADGSLYGIFQNPLGMAVLAQIDPTTAAVKMTTPVAFPGTWENFYGNFTGLEAWPDTVTGAVPEPATWAMMIVGFGLTGAAIRRRRTKRNTEMAPPALALA